MAPESREVYRVHIKIRNDMKFPQEIDEWTPFGRRSIVGELIPRQMHVTKIFIKNETKKKLLVF